MTAPVNEANPKATDNLDRRDQDRKTSSPGSNAVQVEREAWPELSEDSMRRLVDSLRLEPVVRSWDYLTCEGREVSLLFSVTDMRTAEKFSGVPRERLHDTLTHQVYPRFRATFDDGAMAVLGELGLVYGLEESLSKNYYLDLHENGRLFVRYQSINGSRKVGEMPSALHEELLQRMAVLLAERDKQYAPIYAQRQAELQKRNDEEKARAQRASGVVLAAAGEKPLKPMKPIKPAVAQLAAVGGTLAQLKLLTVQGQDVRLPQEHLSSYADIKRLMLKAGFTYQTDKAGSFFRAQEGIDVPAVMQQLCAGGEVNFKQETQFFATPKEVARKALAKFSGGAVGRLHLEPSAGDGAMAKEIVAQGGDVVTIENWDVNIAALKRAGFTPFERDFLQVRHDEMPAFDRVLMNPPFSGDQDVAHVKHALGFLKPDGELVAIISPGFEHKKTKAVDQFRAILELAGADPQEIPAGAFKDSGTSVRTMMVHIRMERLLEALAMLREDGSQYGLNLSRVIDLAANPCNVLPALDYDGPELSEEAAAALRAQYQPAEDSATVWIGDEKKPARLRM